MEQLYLFWEITAFHPPPGGTVNVISELIITFEHCHRKTLPIIKSLKAQRIALIETSLFHQLMPILFIWDLYQQFRNSWVRTLTLTLKIDFMGAVFLLRIENLYVLNTLLGLNGEGTVPK